MKNILKILSNNHLDVLQPPVDISPLVLGGDVLENERPKRDNSTFADIRFRRMGHIRLEEGYEGAEHERGNIPDHVQPPALGSLKTPQEVLLTVSVPYLIGQLNQIIPWKVCSINGQYVIEHYSLKYIRHCDRFIVLFFRGKII